MVERYRLFTDEDTLRLTERTQDPRMMPAISAGCTLVSIHRRGLVHGDLHGNNILFDWRSGQSSLIDLAASERVDLNPEKMATDFLVPRVSMGFDYCQALLAGYIKLARLSIDPIYPGYCDDLLDFLGGEVESDPHLRPEALPAETLNDALPWLGSKLVPISRADRFWLASTTPAQCAFMTGGLIAAGVDCSMLASPPPAGTRSPGHEAIRSLVDSTINRQTASISCPAEVPPIGWDFINLSLAERAAREQPAKGSRVGPDTGIFSTIGALRDIYPQRELEEMLCAFTDVCDWLSMRVDREAGHAGRGLSTQLAQMTYMLLQLVSEPYLLESAELTAARRHAPLSWYPAILDADLKVSDNDLFSLFAYANTRISTYRWMFEGDDSSIEDGRPWTADWRAIYMCRTWLRRLLARRLAHDVPHESTETLDQLTSIAARRLGATLNSHARQTLLSLAIEYAMMSPESQARTGFNELQEELDTVVELLKVAAQPDQPGPPVMPGYITLANQYIDRYSRPYSVPFDEEIAR